MLPISIACKTSSFVSLKKRLDLIYRAVLRKCSIFNSPNDTKQHKVFKKWDKRTVPYYVQKKQPEGCFLINIFRFKFCLWVQCIESFDGRQLLWSIVIIFGGGDGLKNETFFLISDSQRNVIMKFYYIIQT